MNKKLDKLAKHYQTKASSSSLEWLELQMEEKYIKIWNETPLMNFQQPFREEPTI